MTPSPLRTTQLSKIPCFCDTLASQNHTTVENSMLLCHLGLPEPCNRRKINRFRDHKASENQRKPSNCRKFHRSVTQRPLKNVQLSKIASRSPKMASKSSKIGSTTQESYKKRRKLGEASKKRSKKLHRHEYALLHFTLLHFTPCISE